MNKDGFLRRYGLWLGAVTAIGLGAWGVVKIGSIPSAVLPAATLDAIATSDWRTGTPDASVLLIEYGDFQCPACGAYFPIVKKIISEYQDRIAFVYRHFPLPQHQWAAAAARASEAAGAQGKFWQMEELLYSRQQEWTADPDADTLFLKYANELGLDAGQYKRDTASSEIQRKIDSDMQGGIKAGVSATPTFFLNGKKIQPRNYEEFKQAVEAAL